MGGVWKITKSAIVIARENKLCTLYMTSNIRDVIALANIEADTNLWHCKLGHMSEKGMQVMLKKGKLAGLKLVDVGLCEDCIFRKQKKVNFSKIGRTPKVGKLELVHIDVWGPPVTSLGGPHYYVTFVDDSTRIV